MSLGFSLVHVTRHIAAWWINWRHLLWVENFIKRQYLKIACGNFVYWRGKCKDLITMYITLVYIFFFSILLHIGRSEEVIRVYEIKDSFVSHQSVGQSRVWSEHPLHLVENRGTD